MPKLNPVAHPHNAARILSALFRLSASTDLPEVLKQAQGSFANLAPFDLTEVFFVGEQLSVVPQVLWPKPRTSRLFAYLTDRPDDVHLVIDGFKTGRDSLYYCRLGERVTASRWLECMSQPSLLVNQAEGDMIIAAPAYAFVA